MMDALRQFAARTPALESHPLTTDEQRELLAAFDAALLRLASLMDEAANTIDPEATAPRGLPWTLMDTAADVRSIAHRLREKAAADGLASRPAD